MRHLSHNPQSGTARGLSRRAELALRQPAVYLYPGASINPFGHIGIGINTNASIGFYPLTDIPSNVLYGPGVVKADTQAPVESITIETTPDQDAAIQQYLFSHGGIANGNYSIMSSNCTRFVEKALAAGGVASSNTIYPKDLMQALQNLYNPAPTPPPEIQFLLDNPGLGW